MQSRQSTTKKLTIIIGSLRRFLPKSSQASTVPNAKLVGQVVLSTCDAKHALKEWNPFFVKRATRNSYYQNPDDFEVKLKSYVLLAVRKSLPNNPASGRSPERCVKPLTELYFPHMNQSGSDLKRRRSLSYPALNCVGA